MCETSCTYVVFVHIFPVLQILTQLLVQVLVNGYFRYFTRLSRHLHVVINKGSYYSFQIHKGVDRQSACGRLCSLGRYIAQLKTTFPIQIDIFTYSFQKHSARNKSDFQATSWKHSLSSVTS